MPLETSVRTTELANGVRVATEPMPGVASATVGVWVGAGARHEAEEENGLAHFLEHMAFKGTGRRSAREIVETIEDGGGDLNAYTSREITAYHARVLEEDVPVALDIIADILRDPTMTEDDVALERGVILQEIGQSRDTPDDIVFDWAQELAFPGQAMGRPILGAPETVANVDGTVLKRFMAAAYAPERMVVAAAGAVDHDAFVAQAESLFGDLRPAPGGVSEHARYRGGERRVEKDLEQAHLIVGVEGPSYLDPDFFVAQVYATLLGGGMSSRLFQEAREKRGLCYSIFAQASHYADAGVTTIYAGAGGDDLPELLDVIGSEMRAVAEEASEAEIARAKAMLRAGLLMGLESSAARCERAARGLLLHGRIRRIEELLGRIAMVDAASLRAYGEKRILGAAPSLTLYGPVSSAPSLDALQARLAA